MPQVFLMALSIVLPSQSLPFAKQWGSEMVQLLLLRLYFIANSAPTSQA